ncbi:MAG TPA: cell division protein ZapA [Bacteroidaceae bacterium]|nr:cell division protein ZapA [Bacteroidaceae bacterium]
MNNQELSGKFKITVVVNDHKIQMTIPRKDEEWIRLAAKQLNEALLYYKQHGVASDDASRLLSIAALHMATRAVKAEANANNEEILGMFGRLEEAIDDLDLFALKDSE